MNRSVAHLRCAAVWCECSPGWGGSLQRPAPPTGCDLPGTAARRPAERIRLPAGGVGCTPSTGNIPCDIRCPSPSSPGRCCRIPCYTLHIWCQTTWKKHGDDWSHVGALNLGYWFKCIWCCVHVQQKRGHLIMLPKIHAVQSDHTQTFNLAIIYWYILPTG